MHKAAVKNYSQIAAITKSPRELEHSLLLKAAARMQDVHDTWPGDRSMLESALHYNRRLWTVLVGAVAEDSSPLPQELRNNVASLGVFIFKQTMELQAEPAREKLLPLININRELAAGLNAKAA